MATISFWGIDDYRPRWTTDVGDLRGHLRAIEVDFVGHSIRAVWTLWDVEDDAWHNDAPVIVDVGSRRATKRDS